MEVERILNVLGAGRRIQDNFGRAVGSSVVWTAFMSGFHPGVEQSILGGKKDRALLRGSSSLLLVNHLDAQA